MIKTNALFLLLFKVHIFREGHRLLRNLHQLVDWQYIGQMIGGDFAKLVAFSEYMNIYIRTDQTLFLFTQIFGAIFI